MTHQQLFTRLSEIIEEVGTDQDFFIAFHKNEKDILGLLPEEDMIIIDRIRYDIWSKDAQNPGKIALIHKHTNVPIHVTL